jgi:NADH-quinone oxidoreductase subunit N
LIGIPITGGFFAKFYVLNSALKSGLVGLALILVLNSAIGAYYYLRIIVMMYMKEPRGDVPVTRVPASVGLAIAVCVLATLGLGVFPGRVLDFTTRSANQLVEGVITPVNSPPSQ